MKDLRDEINAGRKIQELQKFVEEVPAGVIDFVKRIWKRISWRKECQVAMAFKIATVVAIAARDSRQNSLPPRCVLSFLNFWHLQHDNRLEDPRFALVAPIEVLNDQDFHLMLKQTQAFLGEVCKDLIRIEDKSQSNDDHPHLKQITFFHRSVPDFLIDAETQHWMDERVPPHFRHTRFLFDLALLRLKLVPASYTPLYLLQELLETREFLTDLSQTGGLLSFEESDSLKISKAGMSSLGLDMAAQYEELAIHHLRSTDADGFQSDTDTFGILSVFLSDCARWCASFGLTTFIRELAIRYPMFVNDTEVNAFGLAADFLSKDSDSSKAFLLVQHLLDIGIVCSTHSWQTILSVWWNCNDDALKARIWPLAKLLVSSGIDLTTQLCVAHLRDGDSRFGPGRVCGQDNKSDCIREMPARILHTLVPRDSISELSKLLHNYRDLTWLRKLARERRRKRAALYREARLNIMNAMQQDGPNFEISELGLEYARWVYHHEKAMIVVDPWHETRDCFHPTLPILCKICEVGIHTEGCFHWTCFACLEDYYCTLCLSKIQEQHQGELQCLDVGIDIHETYSDPVGYAIRRSERAFDIAITNHESTKHLARHEATALVYSIFEQIKKRNRRLRNSNDDSKKCSVDGH